MHALLIAAVLLAAPAESGAERVIQITAKKYDFSPASVELKVGVPVVLELRSLDRKHGFAIPDLKIDAQIEPGGVTRVRIVPEKTGTFEFHCDVFCGGGHEEMTGQIVVVP
jgi:cytochrome c oxidase subunit II